MTKPFSSVWLRPPRQPKTSGLRREQIVAAAVELLDAEGLDALSMRKLGARLGAGATSLYWYVANKDELLELALDQAWGEVELPDPERMSWREASSRVVYSLRATMRAHPWMAGLIGRLPSVGPNAFALTDAMRRMFVAAGFVDMDVYYANSTLISFVFGQVIPEVAMTQSMGRVEDYDIDGMRSAMNQLAGQQYPEIVADYESVGPQDVTTARAVAFDFGLLCVLDGLQARLNSTAPARPRTPRQPDPR
ncbi:TetR/AcrR family transcriptional regulator [Nocardia sp. CDC159]|uniref:TetR/AcrR family transcriptional regulator n=1 Tax=Nocardia pulmonis TaxID=2951408 RepID=A0A9X2E196_9NOCA|nr:MULTISPECIES: TetR/AcrR family transcriptional regulator [Nocardia]MCM6772347.1 TetR/AcrR family transcriptional regulator [Nocardia pulmonis]MCM6784995.1 TetR/AcrR family transcriptional regulator [Nocardia sp. CDC159]